jgi:enolase
MTPTRITGVHAWEALDSRGRPTVGCAVTLGGGGAARAIVPAGASTGSHEAKEVRDGGARYGGHGVRHAVAAVRDTLAPAVLGLDAEDQSAVDAALTATDPDPRLGNVGANAVLGVSLAALLAAADQGREPLWRRLGGPRPLLPMPMVNIFSGGAHAGGLLDIQDVLVVPVGASSFAEAIEWASRVRAATASVLIDRGVGTPLVADEGGLAAALDGNEAALGIVVDGIHRAGLTPGAEVALAVDIAANQLQHGDGYRLLSEARTLTAAQWLAFLDRWRARYPLVSVEDALAEDAWQQWQQLSTDWGTEIQVLGDDLFATNEERLGRGITARVANAVLIKPNQAGTVSRAARVVEQARAGGYATVVSARSGDTEDSWLADLAVGWRTGQIKVGSTTRSERTAKWNRLLEIESRAAVNADFAGGAALAGAGAVAGEGEGRR